uniref:diacylglycerol O-acyltransferase n=1 Tax=Sphaeramia orbicularis TaxID=375764 RepID=A0A673C821_9TELE
MNYERAAASETDHNEHLTLKQNHSAAVSDSVCDPTWGPDPKVEKHWIKGTLPYLTLKPVCVSSVHQVQDSLLSSNSRFTAYRGILNWIIILLVGVSSLTFNRFSSIFTEGRQIHCGAASDFQVLTHAHLSVSVCKSCPVNNFCFVFPSSSGGALVSLWVYTVLGLKLYSYQETNSWYRQTVSIHAGETVFSSITLDLYYFLVAPTLCYQRHFPRTSTVHINKLLHRTLEMVKMSFTAPTHFLVLLFFFLCHSYLNFCAELLRFGDRHFYGDWWNATTLISLWENWNIPFHKWCHSDSFPVFFQFVFALPLHSCRLWIFIMMLCELFVAVFLGGYFQGNYGNGLVWLCLLLGPPLAVTTYFHDHYHYRVTARRFWV